MTQLIFLNRRRSESKLPALLRERVKNNRMLVLVCFVAVVFCFMQHLTTFAATPEQAAALSATISGTVLDRATNAPIPYASVIVTGKQNQVQTNGAGRFSVSVAGAEGGSISVSSVGYIPRTFAIADLLKQQEGGGGVKLFLLPKHEHLSEVEVMARSRKWKSRKVGYHIDEGTTFHHEISPSDTIPEGRAGQEIGSRIILKKQPALVQSVSFGLTGSGVAKVEVGIRLYALKNNLPHQTLHPEPIVVAIPPHHTGWITVNLEKYGITLQEDFALVIEWLTETNKLNDSSLMGFATVPKGQVTYYRESAQKPWQILNSTLLSVRSYGMYVTLLYQK